MELNTLNAINNSANIMDVATVNPTDAEAKQLKEMNNAVAINGSSVVNASDYINYLRMMRKKSLVREYAKIGRNELCPCGSGKKYKYCCLKTEKFEQLKEVD